MVNIAKSVSTTKLVAACAPLALLVVICLCCLAPAVALAAEAPTIVSESALTVEEKAADLQAEVDPGGAETTYLFEYGTSGAYGQSTEARVIEAGSKPVIVSAQVEGLEPGRVYHYRVIVSHVQNPAERAEGKGGVLTTPVVAGSTATGGCPNEELRAEQPFGLVLPDCRAYEMVSPVETLGQNATEGLEAEFSRAAESGNAVTYSSNGTFGEPTGADLENQFLARREPGADRWSTQVITPLHEPDGTEAGSSYQASAFTPELTEGIAETNGHLTAEAPVTVNNGASRLDGLYVVNFANGAYRYMTEQPGSGGRAEPLGASTDLTHAVFEEDEDEEGEYEHTVYEWVDGRIIHVSVTNSGVPIPAGVGTAGSIPGTSIYIKAAWRAMSENGSRVFFTSEEEHHLYVRINAEQEQSAVGVGGECLEAAVKACTVAVSPGEARYWGASTSGEKVFFTENGDLYEYRLPLGATNGKLTALTTGGEVQGVTQISEDGSYVYFVADRDLAAGASPGEPNLYVSHEEGPPRFIATLAPNDGGDWSSSPATNTAVVSPGGSWLAFSSEASLTGYDNEQARTNECKGYYVRINNEGEAGKCREIYLYDAATGGLACASCDPTGARPIGPSNLGRERPKYVSYRSRNLLENGTLFFDSYDELVPYANDDRQNVYEYEDGHVYAISNVTGGSESFFLDASASGNDVFFATADQLLPQDTGNTIVVYDARVGGGFPIAASAPSCDNGDSCKPPPSAQPALFGAPATATFSGPGNPIPATPAPAKVTPKKLAKCAKGKTRKAHGKCVKKSKPKQRARAGKAGAERRAYR
jgi:hypothetical protein